jgi:hypothetical protein
MLAHHAYYIEAPLSYFEAYRLHLKPLYAKEHEKFGIDEARALITLASLKNYKDSVFFVAAASIMSEAQQALLKLLEEPQEGTVFVVLVPHGVLMPTLKSRMLAYPHTIVRDADGGPAKKFLALSGKDRSDVITKLLKDDDGQKERVRDFINALERELHKKMADPKARAGLGDISMVRQYLGDRSPSLKMLLEHLALALPTF